MQSPPLLHTKDSTPPSFPPNLVLTPTTMSINVSSISTVSSHPSVSLLLFGNTSPTSTRSNASWGSPHISDVPTFPILNLEPLVAQPVNPSPILFVNIPIHVHHLHKGSFEGHHLYTMHALLYSPYISCILELWLKNTYLLSSTSCICVNLTMTMNDISPGWPLWPTHNSPSELTTCL